MAVTKCSWWSLPNKYYFLIVLCCHINDSSGMGIWYMRNISNNSITATFAESSILPSTTWWHAATTCAVDGGHLVVRDRPGRMSGSHVNQMKINVYYWVGAVQNSAWIWTYDQSPLYSYIGDITVPRTKITHIDGNSASKCYRHCSKSHNDVRSFALKGDNCYCIQREMSAYITTRRSDQQLRCSGNYDELCGDTTRASLYRRGLIKTESDEDGQCVYVRKEGRNILKFYEEHDCNVKKRSACHRTSYRPRGFRCQKNVCVKYLSETWNQSNRTCRLLKVTSTTIKDLYKAIPGYAVFTRQSYWIGLKRIYSWRWINGQSVDTEYQHKYDTNVCLAAYIHQFRPLSVGYVWLPCDDEHPGLCDTVRPIQTTQSSAAGQHTSVLHQSTTPPSNSSEMTVSPAALAADNTGAYVGAFLACVIILIVVGAGILLMRRNRKFCFALATSPPKGKLGYVNSLAESCTDEHYYSTLTREVSIPTAVVKPTIHTPRLPVVYKKSTDESFSTKRHTPNSKTILPDPYYSVPPMADSTDNYYSTPPVETGSLPMGVAKPYNHTGTTSGVYDVAVGVDGVDGARVSMYHRIPPTESSHTCDRGEHDTTNCEVTDVKYNPVCEDKRNASDTPSGLKIPIQQSDKCNTTEVRSCDPKMINTPEIYSLAGHAEGLTTDLDQHSDRHPQKISSIAKSESGHDCKASGTKDKNVTSEYTEPYYQPAHLYTTLIEGTDEPYTSLSSTSGTVEARDSAGATASDFEAAAEGRTRRTDNGKASGDVSKDVLDHWSNVATAAASTALGVTPYSVAVLPVYKPSQSGDAPPQGDAQSEHADHHSQSAPLQDKDNYYNIVPRSDCGDDDHIYSEANNDVSAD